MFNWPWPIYNARSARLENRKERVSPRVLHMTRPLAIALIAVALSSAGCSKEAVESVDTSGPLIVRAEPAKLDTLQTSVTVTGTVSPSPGADWVISAPESGRIVELPKAEGEAVKEGDLLARFEVPSLIAEQAARRAEASQANARVSAAKSNDTRLRGLLARGIASQRETDEASRELQEANAQLNQAEAGLAAADLLAARTVVKARFAGVVAQRWHNVGDQVDPGSGNPVLRVIDPMRLEIAAAVPVAQLALIAPGRLAKIFNPTNAALIDGSVIAIPPAVETTAATGDVRVTLPKDSGLTVGTAVQLEIMSDVRPNVLVVPTAAVLHEGMDAYVMVAGDDGKAHRKSVATGMVARERTQIVSGLTAGEKVILAGAEPVPDGAAITVQK